MAWNHGESPGYKVKISLMSKPAVYIKFHDDGKATMAVWETKLLEAKVEGEKLKEVWAKVNLRHHAICFSFAMIRFSL